MLPFLVVWGNSHHRVMGMFQVLRRKTGPQKTHEIARAEHKGGKETKLRKEKKSHLKLISEETSRLDFQLRAAA